MKRLFLLLISKFNDSPRAVYEYMITHPAYAGYKYIWALEYPDNV